MGKIRILHIMGLKANGDRLEILVVNPEEDIPAVDYVGPGDTIHESQVVELEGSWPYSPDETEFERVGS